MLVGSQCCIINTVDDMTFKTLLEKYMSNKIVRVAVTGAGGGVGQSIIKSLQNSPYDVVALDGELLGAGLYSVPKSYIIPYANNENYIDTLINICNKENCSYLFPGLDAELKILSDNKERFKTAGINVLVSEPGVIDISDNKLLTSSFLEKHGFDAPKSIDMATIGGDKSLANPLPIPYILKRRVGGARSKDVFMIDSPDKLRTLISNGLKPEDFVAQEYIDGDEYTCGTVSLNSECMGVIIMRRILRDGDTYKCFSIRDEKLETYIKNVIDKLKPYGACNVQLRIKDGKYYIFEINARCSGTTAARTLCGFNEPRMILDYLSKGIKPTYKITEQTILRYWNELCIPNKTVAQLQNDGQLKLDKHQSL